MGSNGTQYSHSSGSSMRLCSVRCNIPANSVLSSHQLSLTIAPRILVLLHCPTLHPDSREVWLAWTHLLGMLCNDCCRQEAKLHHLREQEPDCQRSRHLLHATLLTCPWCIA